ncbi:MAG: AMP-dependent synthetase/ligase [Cellulomonadaceae bacterium]
MREFHSPDLNDFPVDATISDLLADRVRRAADQPLIDRKAGLGRSWLPVSARSFADQVRTTARGLVGHGVKAGDRVAIMSRTRYEWTLLDFAIWAAGAVPVPVYETSSSDQIEWICSDAGVTLIVVETSAHASLVEHARASLPDLREVLVIDDGAIEQLRSAGTHVPDAEVDERTGTASGSDLATIIYTSGTTGRPKGVEITHRSFVYLARNGVNSLGEICCGPDRRMLLFLPLAHVFARFLQVVVITSDSVLGHTPDTKNLLADLAGFQPTFLLVVPRVLEKVYNSAEQKAGGGAKLKIFRWAAKVAIETSRARAAGRKPSPVLQAQHQVAEALVYRALRAALGGRVTYTISGGAPLGERLGHFYRGIGLTVLEGYGLTETCAPTTVNRPGLIKIGTVGPAFPGTGIRIDADGEVQVCGDNLFRSYRHNPEATAEAVQHGWFRTGDLGSLDEDGYLRITGRKKEIIVTAGGKNVAPAVLEDRLRGHPLVSQCVVVGDKEPFIGALVTLDAEMLPGWLRTHGLAPMDVATAAHDPQVLAALDRAVERANTAVSRAESIRKIRVLTTDFTEQNGYLTPSLKVKRVLVLHDFADDIRAIYASKRTGPDLG